MSIAVRGYIIMRGTHITITIMVTTMYKRKATMG